jgi:hypothetical protein
MRATRYTHLLILASFAVKISLRFAHMSALTCRYGVGLTSISMRRVWPLIAALGFLAVFGSSAFAAPTNSKHPAAKHAASAPTHHPTEVKLKPSTATDQPDPAQQASAPVPTRGPTRIDFDDRLIQGQSNKSGAVYLYDRKELKTRSMVKKRESFRDEIITSVFDT